MVYAVISQYESIMHYFIHRKFTWTATAPTAGPGSQPEKNSTAASPADRGP